VRILFAIQRRLSGHLDGPACRLNMSACVSQPLKLLQRRVVNLAFHEANTDTNTDILADILARIVARMSACRSACHRTNFRKLRVSDVSARIPAMMFVSVTVSASWNSSLTEQAMRPVSVVCYELNWV